MNNELITLLLMNILGDAEKAEKFGKQFAGDDELKGKCFVTGLKLCDKLTEFYNKIDGDTFADLAHLEDKAHALEVMHKINNLMDEIIKITEEELKNE